jgi:hypothetical protein
VPARQDGRLASAPARHLPENHHGDRVARHIEKLDRVGFFGNTSHGVPFHDRADVAGLQAVLGDIDPAANVGRANRRPNRGI